MLSGLWKASLPPDYIIWCSWQNPPLGGSRGLELRGLQITFALLQQLFYKIVVTMPQKETREAGYPDLGAGYKGGFGL